MTLPDVPAAALPLAAIVAAGCALVALGALVGWATVAGHKARRAREKRRRRLVERARGSRA